MKKLSTVHIVTLMIAALFIGASAGFIFNNSVQKPDFTAGPPVIQGMILPMAKVIGEFELLQNNNQVFNQDNLKGTWSLLFIGYTQCPDVCPMALTSLKQTVSLMAQQGLALPKVVFISIDPERDNPTALNEFVRYFNNEFIGVTGDEDDLDELAKQLAVYYRKVPGISGNVNNDDYLMEHSASLMLVNPEGNLQAVLATPHTPNSVIESIGLSQKYFLATLN